MIRLLINITICFIISSGLAFGQFDIIKKVKEKVEKKTEEKVDEGIDNTVDEAFEGNKEKENETETETETEQTTENSNDVVNENSGTTKKKEQLKSYSKFDFVPGTNLIFYDDFSMDAVADFPQKWNTNGSGEVVTLNSYPGNWFKLNNAASYIPYLETGSFGENFTFEVDFLYNVPENQNYGTLYFDFFSSDKVDEVPTSSGPNAPGIMFNMNAAKTGSADFTAVGVSQDLERSNPNRTDVKAFNDGVVNRLSFAFNKQRFRVYLNEKKVMDLPRILQSGISINRVNIRTWYWNTDYDYSILIKDIRVAEGQPDTRNDLITKGKIVTHGILFDSGSDKIKPESYGTLKDIATTLKDNSSVKVKVVGHTDSDGTDESNLDLSKRRADAVKSALINEFGISDSQLETDGKGESEPIGQNDSPEGKANNRRVEFVKL
ncbi:MAG: OmpA family protein [Ignavibacteriales bacterium]|nr:MAG: OmpA family protein [Ignavibacteriales bacterium]